MVNKLSKLFSIFALSIASVFAFSFSIVSMAKTSPAIEIEIDYGEYDPRYLPEGLVGESYPVFPCEATYGDEILTDVDAFVYAPDGYVLPVTGGMFKTAAVGKYTIEYVAKRSDEVGRKNITVTVSEDERALTYKFSDEIVASAYTGTSVFVYGGIAGGGIGDVSVTTKVLSGDVEISLEKANGGYYFTPEKAGEYTVNVTLSDLVGRKIPFNKTVTVTDSEAPILNAPSLPRSVVVGGTIKFPTADGVLYSGEKKTYFPVSVYFDGVKVSKEMEITASEAGTYEIKYVCENKTAKAEYSATIEVVAEKEIFVENHLALDNLASVSVSGDMEYILKTVENGKNASLYFDTAIPETALAIEMKDVAKNYGSAKITFTDSKKAEQKIEIPVKKFGELFHAEYDVSKKAIVNQSGEVIYEIGYYANGKKFEGFDSGKAYIGIELIDVSDESQITLFKIGARRITSRKLNNTVEYLTSPDYRSVLTTYAGYKVETEVVTAYDLFGSSVPVKFTVTGPDKKVILTGSADKRYEFYTEQYGRYRIEYQAYGADAIMTTVYCYDIVPPEIKVGKLPESVEVGTTLTLPEAEYSDNYTSTDKLLSYVYVLYGNNRKELIKDGSYTFKTAGEYTIRYAVYDEYQNYTVAEFTVIAR